MTDDNNNLPKPLPEHALSVSGSYLPGDYTCQVCAHTECLSEECEVKRLLSQISEAQIKVSVITSYVCIALSALCFVGSFIFHLWCVVHQIDFPLTWWEGAIMMAPIGGGLVIRLRSKTPISIDLKQKMDEN